MPVPVMLRLTVIQDWLERTVQGHAGVFVVTDTDEPAAPIVGTDTKVALKVSEHCIAVGAYTMAYLPN